MKQPSCLAMARIMETNSFVELGEFSEDPSNIIPYSGFVYNVQRCSMFIGEGFALKFPE